MHITKNFIPLADVKNPKEYIKHLQEIDPDVDIKYDTRNDIVCIDPTYDLLCIANYYDFLTSISDEWISTGYLDLGLVPIFMSPSFMPNMEQYLESVTSKLGAQCYILRPVSFIRTSYIGPNDIWIKREDFRKYLSNFFGYEVTEEMARPSMWLKALHGAMTSENK